MKQESTRTMFRLEIDEPEDQQAVMFGTISGLIHIKSISYSIFEEEKAGVQLAIKPRYEGHTMDDVFSGDEVIVNIVRQKESSFATSSIPPEVQAEDFEFFAIGSIKLAKNK
jgi:hypothetical protein